MTLAPFSKTKLIELIGDNKIDESKEYIKTYFFKVLKPLSIYFYDAVMSEYYQYKTDDITKSFLTDNISYDTIEHKKVITNKLSDWFRKKEDTNYYIKFNVKEKRLYKKDNINYINLFGGFKYGECIEEEQTEYIKDGLSMIWKHIKEVICSDNIIVYEYVKKWICHFLNGKKMTTALYLKGTQGAGKSTLTNFLSNCIGKKNSFITQSTSCLTSGFNGELKTIILLVLEEMCCSKEDWKKMNSELKSIITAEDMSFNDKGEKAIMLQNNISLIITSNEAPIQMDGSDRRYCMTDISNHKAGDFEYFKKLYSYLEDETIQKAFYFECKRLANEKIFNEHEELNSTVTSAKTETLIKNLHPLYKYIRNEYILKNKDFNIFLKDLTKDFNMNSEMKNDMLGMEISRMLKEINITGKASTGNKHRYNIPHSEILEIYNKKKWIHELDEFENDPHGDININYKEQVALLKNENEKLKEQLNEKANNAHYEFLNNEIKKLKEIFKDQQKDKTKADDLHELIKTVSPKNSPKIEEKKETKFPRPVINKNNSLKVDISNMTHKSIIDEIF